jgi:hypothetical protein
MLDELRHHIARYLDARQTAVLSAWGWQHPWALPVQYRRRGLEIECLLPRWADLLSLLAEDSRLLLVVTDDQSDSTRWLEVQGTAQRVATPVWGDWTLPAAARPQPENRYAVIRITPRRLDLIDDSQGWGFRETLEL